MPRVFLHCLEHVDSTRIEKLDARPTILSNLLYVAVIKNNEIKSSEYAEKYVNAVEEKFLKKTAYMTPTTREYYFMNISESSSLLQVIASAAVRSQRCSGAAYNAALFQKGMLVRCNNETRNNIFLSGDNDLRRPITTILMQLL